MADDIAPDNPNEPEVQRLNDMVRELQARHEKLVQFLSNPTEEMMLAGALAHNAGLRPLRESITAGEAKNIFAAMVAAMKESH